MAAWCEDMNAFHWIALKEDFHRAQDKAFAPQDASFDAMKLFTVALADFERDGHHLVGSPSPPAVRCGILACYRAEALKCSLSNPVICSEVRRRRTELLGEARRFRAILKEAGAPIPPFLDFFTAWLEANVEEGMESESDSLPEALAFWQRIFPSIVLRGMREEDLLDAFAASLSITAEEGGEGRKSFLPSREEQRQLSPPRCTACGTADSSYLRCTACHLAVYCSADCQRRDWRRKPGGHKGQCARLKSLVLDVTALKEL
mmetsp:Transcript_27498/g.53944  ORF Transcript_27498/g.53944 Transcript_27498/m.53944 type:complete len:261 (-) Transcript_27498:44-826(-)